IRDFHVTGVQTCALPILIVAARNATFGLPEVKRGLVPGSGGMVRPPARIPYHIAMEAVLTGDMMTAERLHHYGLVNRLVEPGTEIGRASCRGRAQRARGA